MFSPILDLCRTQVPGSRAAPALAMGSVGRGYAESPRPFPSASRANSVRGRFSVGGGNGSVGRGSKSREAATSGRPEAWEADLGSEVRGSKQRPWKGSTFLGVRNLWSELNKHFPVSQCSYSERWGPRCPWQCQRRCDVCGVLTEKLWGGGVDFRKYRSDQTQVICTGLPMDAFVLCRSFNSR